MIGLWLTTVQNTEKSEEGLLRKGEKKKTISRWNWRGIYRGAARRVSNVHREFEWVTDKSVTQTA